MAENILGKLFEHNNWANQQVIQACLALNDEQLDAPPQSVTMGTIRQTLTHLVSAQRGYLALLTLPREARPTNPLALAELQESARTTGEGLLALARGEAKEPLPTRVQNRDGNFVESWVVLVQVINHATEHREQIKSMLSALGLTLPEIDG
jgi:uncharacterized damage-inducible protein DinB